MLERYLIPAFLVCAGVFALVCAAKNVAWFMEHRKAQALAAIIGRRATRYFYMFLGFALVVLGVVMFVGRPA